MRFEITGEVVDLPAVPGANADCPSERGFECTLDAGHSGVHVAHGLQLPRAFWHDGDTGPTIVVPLEPTP